MDGNGNAASPRLDYKDALCPLSGIGKRPTEWSACVEQCSLFDATAGYRVLCTLFRLRELTGMLRASRDYGDTLMRCLFER